MSIKHFPIDMRTIYHHIHHYWNKSHVLLLSLTNFHEILTDNFWKKAFTGSEYSQNPLQGISFVNPIIVHIPSLTKIYFNARYYTQVYAYVSPVISSLYYPTKLCMLIASS